jgi:Lar family restriction alleviation protein
MIDLLPCPFCGVHPTITRVGNDKTPTRKVTIKCPKCRASMTEAGKYFSMGQLEINAAELWNRRFKK